MNELNLTEYKYYDQTHNFYLPWVPDISVASSGNIKSKININYCEDSISIPTITNLSNLVGINQWNNASRWMMNNEEYILTNGFGLMHIDAFNNVKFNISRDKSRWSRMGWLLYNSVGLPIILRKKGYLILHGNVITKNDKTILILGESGYGKSTLTASMIFYNGWELLSDDLGVIKTTEKGVNVVPGIPLMKLASHNLKSLFNLSPEDFPTVGHNDYKVYVPSRAIGNKSINKGRKQKDVKLTNIIVLKPEKPSEPIAFKRIPPVKSVGVLSHNLYSPWSMVKNELEHQTREICKILNFNVNIHTLFYPRDISKLRMVCEELDNLD